MERVSDPTYVYVVEQGCYSSRGIVGVYATADAAMQAHPGNWTPNRHAEPGYQWDNGLDWEDAKDITQYEVHN